MSGLLDRFRGRKGSGSMAKERLQFILVHDRINLPPERLNAMKREILEVISKYVSVESEKVDIALQQRDRNNLLVAEIPFSDQGEEAAALALELGDIDLTFQDSKESTQANEDDDDSKTDVASSKSEDDDGNSDHAAEEDDTNKDEA